MPGSIHKPGSPAPAAWISWKSWKLAKTNLGVPTGPPNAWPSPPRMEPCPVFGLQSALASPEAKSPFPPFYDRLRFALEKQTPPFFFLMEWSDCGPRGREKCCPAQKPFGGPGASVPELLGPWPGFLVFFFFTLLVSPSEPMFCPRGFCRNWAGPMQAPFGRPPTVGRFCAIPGRLNQAPIRPLCPAANATPSTENNCAFSKVKVSASRAWEHPHGG